MKNFQTRTKNQLIQNSIPQADSESDKLLKQALDNIEQGVKKFQELTGIQTEFDKNKLEKFLKDNFGKVHDKFQELIKTIDKDVSEMTNSLTNRYLII